MIDLTAITTPFGLLDETTREALMAHGGPWEVFTTFGWGFWGGDRLAWTDDRTYRVKPQPPSPREWWVTGGNCLWDTYAEAYNACDRGEKPIRVIEKLPD